MTAMSMRGAALYRRLAADAGALELATGPAAPGPVTEAQLDGLPGAAQRYLRFMGAVGKPADWSFLAHVTGKFRMRPGRAAGPPARSGGGGTALPAAGAAARPHRRHPGRTKEVTFGPAHPGQPAVGWKKTAFQ